MSWPGPRERKEPSPPFKDPNPDKGKALASLKSGKKIVKLTKTGKQLKNKIKKNKLYIANMDILKTFSGVSFDLDGMPIKDLKSLKDSMIKCKKIFPEAFKNLNYVGTKIDPAVDRGIKLNDKAEGILTNSLADCRRNKNFAKEFYITFNKNYLQRNIFQSLYDEALEIGPIREKPFHAITFEKDAIKNVFYHEFGHLIYHSISDDDRYSFDARYMDIKESNLSHITDLGINSLRNTSEAFAEGFLSSIAGSKYNKENNLLMKQVNKVLEKVK
ncbi:hypothetical protein M0R19_04490 [Candidatus Pacearchaeota archaeon]|jgi:hypothetical protein|nr:hypothetical protein [Candidatus Pacearchaeota archaeon]